MGDGNGDDKENCSYIGVGEGIDRLYSRVRVFVM